MKILSNQQIREADRYTIENEPIRSVDLMERAASGIFEWLKTKYDKQQSFVVICGLGNNGGDGLALARMLHKDGFRVLPVIMRHSNQTSDDFKINEVRLLQLDLSLVRNINHHSELNDIKASDVIIDALFGSGLSRPLEGSLSELVKFINSLPNTCISIDLPSGMYADEACELHPARVVKANYTLSFQIPKLCFYIAENSEYLGELELIDIGLSKTFIDGIDAEYTVLTKTDAAGVLRFRNKFAHKGNFGHALIIAGSKGKMGAAVLAARACLRSGAGVLTCHVPACGYDILQVSVPEAMVEVDENENYISNAELKGSFKAIGIGPGIGQEQETSEAIQSVLSNFSGPVVLDADALNLLAANPELLEELKPGSVLTPHPKEFERLFGVADNGFERLKIQIQMSKEKNLYIILKGHHTSISTPSGKCYFNTSGNPGMATAGSGDVLTGILTGLLAQEYNNLEACILGVFIHGHAGDLALLSYGEKSLMASDIINHLPEAYLSLSKS